MPGSTRTIVVHAGLAASAAIACAALAVPGDPTRYTFWRDTVAHDLPFLLAAVALFLAPAADPVRRRAWRLLGTGCGLALVGNVYITLRPGWPLPADLCWLTFYGTVFASTALVLRDRATAPGVTSWWDPLAAAAAGAAVTLGLVVPAAQVPPAGQPLWQHLVTLAYPAADVALMAVLVGGGLVAGRGDRQWWLLFTGLAVWTASDLGYLVQVSEGSYRPGGWLNAGWPVAMSLFGAAAWLRDRPAVTIVTLPLRVPAVVSVVAVALLVVGQTRSLPAPAVVLAVLAVVLAGARIGLAVRAVLRSAAAPAAVPLDPSSRQVFLGTVRRAAAADRGPLALVLLDVDHFAVVNNALGERAGDRLLAVLARRLDAALLPGADLSRLGGDRFAVVVDTGAVSVEAVLRSVDQTFSRPFELDGARLPLTVSTGICPAQDAATSAEQLLARADIALDRARRDRTGVETYRADRDDPGPERLDLLSALHEALAGDQLVLHYQPQVDAVTGRPRAIEALVRWRHPTRGLLGPSEFLPLAQQFSLMPAVTQFVLTRAVADGAELSRRGWRLRVAVNLAGSDLADPQLSHRLGGILDRHGLAPEQLTVEVSEDAVLRDDDTATAVLHQIRTLGVRLSLDDYGTGQASLQYLKRLPISEVKLAREFVAGVPDDASNAAIIRSTVALAHDLRLQVVVEGVEGARELEFLAGTGCDLAQGFHLAAPLPLAELEQWLEARRPALRS